MPKPNASLSIRDPGLGIVPASAGRTQVKLGVCQKGVNNQVLSISSIRAAEELLGSGPMTDAVAQVGAVAGWPVLAMPLPVNSLGTVTNSFALSGVGTGTVSGSKGPEQIVKVKIIAGGALATMTFQVAVGTGAYGATVASGADPYTYIVPLQQLTKLAFAAGTYVANDVYQLNLDGTITRVGSGTATLLDGSSHSPVDAYAVQVKIVTAGGLGTGAFIYSLDEGKNWSGSIGVPSSGKYVIPSTGIVLTFSGTFSVDDVYSGTTTAPSFLNSDLNTALTALHADPSLWGFFHVVGTPSSAANAATLAGVVSAQLTAMEAGYRYTFGIIECPPAEGAAAIKTAFASFVDSRVAVATVDEDLVSPLTGREHRRSSAWAYAARLSAIKLSAHPGQVAPDEGGGALKNVRALYDAAALDGLDDARFVTPTTHLGQPGYFVTRGRMMAAPSSDYEQVMNRRVMDRACTVARANLLLQVNKPVRINDEGFIDERDAQAVESGCEAALRAALVSEDECSDVRVTCSRDDNLLSTSTLNVDIEIVPFGYTEFIKGRIGMKNPALQQQAAA